MVPLFPYAPAVPLMSLPLDADELSDQLRVEFRDDAQDRLDLIYQTLEKRVADLQAGAYQSDIDALKSMSLDILKQQYSARVIEP